MNKGTLDIIYRHAKGIVAAVEKNDVPPRDLGYIDRVRTELKGEWNRKDSHVMSFRVFSAPGLSDEAIRDFASISEELNVSFEVKPPNKELCCVVFKKK